VIDSGFHPHPYFLQRGYRIRYVPTEKDPYPHVDHYGHGTAHLANIFALAPEAQIHAIKCTEIDPYDAIEKALELRPDILSCAWGFDIDHPDEATRGELPSDMLHLQEILLKAIESGITVVAAGGNLQYAFPACMPEVIAAGGVNYEPNGEFTVSDASSKFESTIFPGRQVPDLCGLVGKLPHARLLLVPVPPRAQLAKKPAFSAIAASDSSAAENEILSGWAVFSGTSASTAMIAGAAALLKQIHPGFSPEEIKRILVQSARVVADSDRLLDAQQAVALAESLVPGHQR
jgi:hypothetical protein